MAFRDVLNAFAEEEVLPIDLSKVAGWIKGQGIQDEIEFIGVELDVGVLRGFLHRFRYRASLYGEPICAAHIYYAQNQPEHWINLVCCKELIHLMDGAATVARKEDFDTLINRLVLPREVKIMLEDPAFAQIDKFGDAIAAGLLLPYKLRDELLKPYCEGRITVDDIARMAVMPARYVRMVMSESWERIYTAFMTL